MGLILAFLGIIVSFAKKIYLAVFGMLIILLNFIYAANYDIIDIESYFLPMIMILSIFLASGTIYLLKLILDSSKNARPVRYIIVIALILLPVSALIENFLVSDRSSRTFAKQGVIDMINSMDENGLAIVENWDFYSPWLYFHFEGNLRPDIILLDKELMRRSWYLEFIKRKHPDIYTTSSAAIENFLNKVRPFERSDPFNPDVIDRAYYTMLRTIILHQAGKRPVYTNISSDRIFTRGLPMLPSGILYKIDNSNDFVETKLFQFKKELWGNKFIFRGKRIVALLSYYRSLFPARADYCNYFKHEDEAEYYKKLTAEVTAVMDEISKDN